MNNKYNNCNYNIIRSNGTELIQSDKLPQDEVFHGFSTRNGGVSREPYASLNLGLSRDEPKENIMRNFRILCDALIHRIAGAGCIVNRCLFATD